MAGEIRKGLFGNRYPGELLPAVGNDIVGIPFFPAAQVKDQPVLAHPPDQFGKAVLMHHPVLEHRRGDNHRAGPLIQPKRGIVRRDSAAHLQSLGKGLQGLGRGRFVALAQHDHMAAEQPVVLVHGGIVGGGQVRGKVGGQAPLLVVGERGADNLFYPAMVEVDARSEFHGLIVCPGKRGYFSGKSSLFSGKRSIEMNSPKAKKGAGSYCR